MSAREGALALCSGILPYSRVRTVGCETPSPQGEAGASFVGMSINTSSY
jgi:hypothetical protein